MKYCTKCGREINDDDKFCPNCGFEITRYTIKENDVYSDNYSDRRYLKIHPCTNLSLIFSIIGYGLFFILIALVLRNFHNSELPKLTLLIIVLSYFFSLISSIAAVGTGIPGFISSKIRKIESKRPFVVLIISIILAITLVALYVYVYIAQNLM